MDGGKLKVCSPAQLDVSGVCHTCQPLILGEKHTLTVNLHGSLLNTITTVLVERRKCTSDLRDLAFFEVLEITHRKVCSMKMRTKSRTLLGFVLMDLHVGTRLPPLSGKVVVVICLLFLI